MIFKPIDLKKCEQLGSGHSGTEHMHKSLVFCEIRPLFDENEILPIKHAYITVEIIVE